MWCRNRKFANYQNMFNICNYQDYQDQILLYFLLHYILADSRDQIQAIIWTCYDVEYGYLNIFDKPVPEIEPLHYVLAEDEFTTRL